MIIVTPFTGHSDYTRALARALTVHNSGCHHRLVVSTSPEHSAEAQEFVDEVKGLFLDASVEHVKAHGATPVRLFRDGVMAAARVTPTQQEIINAPICWIEPGWLPSQRDWSSTLSSAFFNVGGGGRVLASWIKQPDYPVGRVGSSHVVDGGYKPVGVVVFPAVYIRQSGMVRQINTASSAWQTVLRYELERLRVESPLLDGSPSGLFTLSPAAEPPAAEPPAAEPPAAEPPAAEPPAAAGIRRTATRAGHIQPT